MINSSSDGNIDMKGNFCAAMSNVVINCQASNTRIRLCWVGSRWCKNVTPAHKYTRKHIKVTGLAATRDMGAGSTERADCAKQLAAQSVTACSG